MIEVIINHNELKERSNQIDRESQAEAVRLEVLYGIVIVRRLQAAKIPIEGITFPLLIKRGTLLQSMTSSTLIYRWYDDGELKIADTVTSGKKGSTIKVDPLPDDSEDL